MNSDSDNSQIDLELRNEFKQKELGKEIKKYLETDIKNDLSSVQKKQLTRYRTYLHVKKLTDNEITSIENHIKSAIYNDKEYIQTKIKEMKDVYKQHSENETVGKIALKEQKVNILEQLEHELNFLPDNYLSKADSDYFTNQLDLLKSNKYVLRDVLLKIVNRNFFDQKIGTYP